MDVARSRKKDRAALTDFLERNASLMPRTSLRYAIEHYPETDRKAFLSVKQIKNK
jgi:DNA alkylation repair enzyme.